MGRSHYAKSLELARREDFLSMTASVLWQSADLVLLEGDFTEAIAMYREGAQLFREWGYQGGVADILCRLGQIALRQNDTINAQQFYAESLAICKELEHSAIQIDGLLDCILGFAGIAGISGQDMRAANLFGAHDAAADRHKRKLTDFTHQVIDPIIAAVREHLGDERFQAEWKVGRKMTLEQALELAHE